MLLCYIVLFSSLVSVLAYPNGAPESVCSNRELKPQHSTEYITGGNYTITVSAQQYVPGGEKLTIILYNKAPELFKGFIVMAKRPRNFETRAVGEMLELGGITKRVCYSRTGHGLTHSKGFRPQQRVVIEWTPPSICQAKDMKNIRFQASFVESYAERPTILVYSDVIKMKPLPNKILCENGCGKKCSPCVTNTSDPFRVEFMNCTETGASRSENSAWNLQVALSIYIACLFFMLFIR